MQIKNVPIKEIIPYERNNRVHSDQQIDRIANSIHDFGFNQPIVVDEANVILVGHGRLFASLKLGLREVPVYKLGGLTPAQKKAYRILDNKLQNDSTWNIDNLPLELQELRELGFDFERFGLEELEVNIDPEPEEDDFDPDSVDTTECYIKRGDLIEIGSHRLLCGDSTSAEDVGELMSGKIAELMNTDPPYGIAYVSNAQSKGQSVDYGEIQNDELDGEALQDFLEKAIKVAVPYLKDNAAFYLWHPMLTQGTFFAAAAAAADILINRQIIWVKPNFIFGRGDYHWKHELCFYGWRRGFKPDFYGARNQDTVWLIGRENDKIHPTQKPLELFTRPIKNHTKSGAIVYEPFSGSGSQLIAADQLGRICYGMEIEPKYCQVVIERYIKYCEGKNRKAVVKINGKPYAP